MCRFIWFVARRLLRFFVLSFIQYVNIFYTFCSHILKISRVRAFDFHSSWYVAVQSEFTASDKAVCVCSVALWGDVVLGWCLHHRPSTLSFSLLPFLSLERRAGSANPISSWLEQTQPSIPCTVHTRNTQSFSFFFNNIYVCYPPWPWGKRHVAR